MQDHNETSDASLMSRYQDHGDTDAFGQIVTRFLPPAVAVARQILSDRALAEDAVQETFLHIVRRRRRYIPSMPFSSWFYAILRNVCKDMLRRRSRQADLVRNVAARETTRHEAPPSTDTLERLATLPNDMRAVLTFRVVYDMSFRDIAAALGISEEAAKKRAQRALRRLREGIAPLRGVTASCEKAVPEIGAEQYYR
jgi:RNA polymerase sigma-70 factor (ECF subfamily)